MPTSELLADLQRALAEANPRRILLAYSGGLDSTVLLHLLSRSPLARERGLRGLHVDHGIYPDSSEWARRCIAFGEEIDVPVSWLRCEVDRASGRGLEAAARQARYAALSTELSAGDWLATAHHRDDQAETLLLRLLRGSGSRGLSAMRKTRPLGDATLWRPLLDWPRATLRRYADQHGLRWIEDPSNRDSRHDRSWLREEIMPRLRQRWPSAGESLAASAALLAEESDWLDSVVEQTLASLRLPDGSLPIDALLAMPAPRRAQVLRCWLRVLGAEPLPRRLHEQLDRDVLRATADATPELRWSGMRLRRYRNALSLARDDVASENAKTGQPDPRPISWDGRAALAWPGGGHLCIDPAWDGPALSVSHRRGGERIQLSGRQHHHSLKKLLQLHGVAPWERAAMPLLWSLDGELLAAGDRLLSATMQHWLQRTSARLIWRRSENA